MKGFCKVTSMPLRAEAADRSEMISQLLFGEFFEKIAETEKPNWIKIRCLYDGYEGFCDPKQVEFLEDSVFDIYYKRKPQLSSKIFTAAHYHQKAVRIPQGGDFRVFGQKDGPERIDALQFAVSYLGVPYFWGGRSPFGIDCSGLSQVVFAYRNIKLPRDAYQQAEMGEKIEFGKHQQWDLAFFANAEGKIIHVGILLRSNDLLHASGEVKISQLTEKGALADDGVSFSHQLAFIKRIV
jgi:gamma-D-glutamyl-L-lysine dipeptidyl-peptidase